MQVRQIPQHAKLTLPRRVVHNGLAVDVFGREIERRDVGVEIAQRFDVAEMTQVVHDGRPLGRVKHILVYVELASRRHQGGWEE